MRKKIFVALIMLVAIPMASRAYDVNVDNLYFNVDAETKTAVVTHHYSYVDLTEIIIPEEIYYGDNPFKVTSIGKSAFSACRGLTSVVLPNTIVSIGEYAFVDCEQLSSITIPQSVTSIGSDAFMDCSQLSSITIPQSVTSIGSEAFMDCIGLTTVSYLSSADIPRNLFLNCTGLVSVSIAEGVTTIGDSSFYGCSNITSINIPTSVTAIDDYAFYKCSKLSSITIPANVTSIGTYVFRDCINLKDIYILSTQPFSVYTLSTDSPFLWLHVPEGYLKYYNSYGSREYIIIEDYPGLFPDCPQSEERNYALYLYQQGIIEGENGELLLDRNVKRAEVAKSFFNGLFVDTTNDYYDLLSDYLPSVYYDLQDQSTYYYRAAKALLYLEYGDGVTPFDRDRLSFEPEGQIARDHVLKVLMETFNIQPDLTSTDNPFPNDANVVQLASTQPRLMGYIRKAAQLGIITTDNDEFRPYAYCTRGEAFTLLAKIIRKIELFEIPQEVLSDDDFFQPLNTTLKTIALGVGLELGNFMHYAKTSFDMDGVMPLTFSHSYNSYNTTLPTVFFGDKSSTGVDDSYKPMGDGWSHTYHSFISVVGDLTDDSARAIVHWGGGQIDIYKSDGTNLIPESMGVYDDCQLDGRDVVVTSKSQIKYRFSKQENSESAILHLTTITDRNGNTLTINYEDGAGNTKRISSVSDGHRSLFFSYLEGSDLLREVRAPENRTISFTYFDNPQTFKKQLQSFTDAEGNTTIYEYNNLSNPAVSKLLTKIRLPKGNYIENEYDANRRLTKTTNGLNDTPITQTLVSLSADYRYNQTNMSSEVNVLKNETSYSRTYYYNDNNVITYLYTPARANMSCSYENSAHPELPSSINFGYTKYSSISYDDRGNLTSFVLKDDLQSSMTYDEMNNLTSITDPNGNTTTYTYDTNGNLIKISAPEEVTTNITVDSRGLPTEITNALGIKTQFEYDDYGNLTKTLIPALNLESSARYDNASRLTSTTDELNRTKSFEYNKNDFLTGETDAANHATQYEYDANDNLLKITNAKNGVTSLSYDDVTDWLTSVSFGGFTKRFSYNTDGTLKSYTKPDGTSVDYTFSEAGQIISDGIYTYEYTEPSLLYSISDGNKTRVFDYHYNHFNKVSESSCNDITISYDYDYNGNCTRINDISYSYDGQNRLTEIYYQGNYISYEYRKDNQLSSIGYSNGLITFFNYDDAGRLIGKSTLLGDKIIAQYENKLDQYGNIIEQTTWEPFRDLIPEDKITKYVYNEANRITQAGDISFEFDANGNTTQRGNEVYIWDIKDRLVNAGGTEITYDPTGVISSYGDITFTIDPLGMGNVISDSKSGADYIYGNGLEARIINGVVSFYVTDMRGSIVAIVDENGNITHKYQYDDFGNVLQKEEADYNPFQYVGKYGVMYLNDHLYYMRARYYDPTIGRFLSEDPIWSTNLYPYADNNPIMGIDPEGTLPSFIDKRLDLLADKIYQYGGEKVYGIMDNISKGKYFGTVQWKYLLDQSYNLMEQGYVEKNVAKQQVGSFLYFVCSAWQEDTWADTFTLFDAGSSIAEFFTNPNELTTIIGKTGKLKLVDMRTKFGRGLKIIYNGLDLMKSGYDFIDSSVNLLIN